MHAMTTPLSTRFLEFLGQLSLGGGTREEWEFLVVTHYPEKEIEQARRNLVKASIAAGVWDWSSPPQLIRHVAAELYAGLRATGV